MSTTTVLPREATFIPFKAQAGRESDVRALLTSAAALVRKTEPQTLQWLGLQADEAHFAIIDFFPNAAGRAAHFDGQVAAALKGAAPTAVEGGWDEGVVAQVENAQVLGFAARAGADQIGRLATRIAVEARPGREEEMAALLSRAAILVQRTEPQTLLWYSLRISSTRFAIFDVFETDAGRAAHFAGEAAAVLMRKAPDVIEGGWESGVVANVRNYTILSIVV